MWNNDDTGDDVALIVGAAARWRLDTTPFLAVECTAGGIVATRVVGAASLAIPTFFPSDALVQASADLRASDFAHLPFILRPAFQMGLAHEGRMDLGHKEGTAGR